MSANALINRKKKYLSGTAKLVLLYIYIFFFFFWGGGGGNFLAILVLVNSWKEIVPGIYLETSFLTPLCKLFFQGIKPGHVGVGCVLCKVRTWV